VGAKDDQFAGLKSAAQKLAALAMNAHNEKVRQRLDAGGCRSSIYGRRQHNGCRIIRRNTVTIVPRHK